MGWTTARLQSVRLAPPLQILECPPPRRQNGTRLTASLGSHRVQLSAHVQVLHRNMGGTHATLTRTVTRDSGHLSVRIERLT